MLRKRRAMGSLGKLFRGSLAAAVILTPMAVQANNPCIATTISTADPAPSVFNDTLYLYCTQDDNGSLAITNIHCYSTTNLCNWKDEGVVLNENSIPWCGKLGNLWAPHVVFAGGKYHMYFPETKPGGVFYVGHATCSTPHGTFVSDNREVYIAGGTTYTNAGLDPYVIQDTGTGGSGKNYLAWCITGITPNRLYVGELNATMDSVKATPTQLPNAQFYPDGGHYVEGQWWVKRNNLWYHIYACYYPGGAERIGVATSSTITGTYTFRGWLMGENSNSAAGTIHPGVCYYKNKFVMFWHCGGAEFGGSLIPTAYLRSTGAEEFTFNTNANPWAIVSPRTPANNWVIPKTYRGVGIPLAYRDTIQIDRYSSSSGCNVALVQGQPTGHCVAGITNNSSVQYDSVDFQTGGAASVAARVSSTGTGGSIEIRIGSTTGTLLATITVPSTGSLTTWQTPSANVTADVSGKQNLVCVFKTPATNLFRVNWIKFEPKTAMNNSGGKVALNGFSYRRVAERAFVVEAPALLGVSLMNIKGQRIAGIKQTRLEDGSMLVNLGAERLPAGMYFLAIQMEGATRNIPLMY